MATIGKPALSEQFNYEHSPQRHEDQNISGSIDQGYFVSPDYPTKDRFYNGYLSFQDPGTDGQVSRVGLFVKNLDMSISLSGQTAQSHGVYQFFAHNLNTPEIMITCQARSSFEYSYIAEFIRMTQVYLASNFEPSSQFGGLVNFTLEESRNGTGNDNLKGTTLKRKKELAVLNPTPLETGDTQNGHAEAYHGNVTGGHKGIDVLCYITRVSRLAEVETNMYEFQFGLEYFDVNEPGGLPFTKLVQGDLSVVEGIQWDQQEISAHPDDFVAPTNVSYSYTPHRNKKKNKNGAPSVAPPATQPTIGQTLSGFGGDTSSLFNHL